jgi:hypothetical protein
MKNFIFVILAAISTNAHSITECTVKIDSMHAGDAGRFYILYEGGGSVTILDNDPNLKNAISLALTAFTSNKHVVIRYNSDGVSCTANFVNDFKGLTILSS